MSNVKKIILTSDLCDIDVYGTISLKKEKFNALTPKLCSVIIPSRIDEIDVKGINNHCFDCCDNIVSIQMPNITRIGEWSFHNCNKLKEINLPSSLEFIGACAFSNCRNLKNIKLPDSLKYIHSYAFSDCDFLEEVVLPNNLLFMDKGVFSNCCRLINVQLSSKVKTLSAEIFQNCVSLTSINIPDNISMIKEWAFAGCTNLHVVSGMQGIDDSVSGLAFYQTPWLENKRKENPLVIVNDVLIDGQTTSGDVTIPDNVVVISEYAFHKNKNITSITMSKNISCIYEKAFANCNSLKSVILPNNPARLFPQAFFSCNALKNIVIPKNYKFISASAIDNCPNVILEYKGSDSELKDVIDNNMNKIHPEIKYFATGEIDNCISIHSDELNKLDDFIKNDSQKEYAIKKIDNIINSTSDLNKKLKLLTIRDNVDRQFVNNANIDIEK